MTTPIAIFPILFHDAIIFLINLFENYAGWFKGMAQSVSFRIGEKLPCSFYRTFYDFSLQNVKQEAVIL